MPRYTLTGKADSDIQNIAETSIAQWGLHRAEAYILTLHDALQRLADFPDIGRNAHHIRPGYLQSESGSHTIFYRTAEDGIIIVRILHERMNFKRHL